MYFDPLFCGAHVTIARHGSIALVLLTFNCKPDADIDNLNGFVEEDASLEGLTLVEIMKISTGTVFNNAAQVCQYSRYMVRTFRRYLVATVTSRKSLRGRCSWRQVGVAPHNDYRVHPRYVESPSSWTHRPSRLLVIIDHDGTPVLQHTPRVFATAGLPAPPRSPARRAD